MPEISWFYGVVVKLYFADHNPPHFHAEYGGHEAIIEVATQRVIVGRLPRARFRSSPNGPVCTPPSWSGSGCARAHQPLERIDPLP